MASRKHEPISSEDLETLAAMIDQGRMKVYMLAGVSVALKAAATDLRAARAEIERLRGASPEEGTDPAP